MSKVVCCHMHLAALSSEPAAIKIDDSGIAHQNIQTLVFSTKAL